MRCLGPSTLVTEAGLSIWVRDKDFWGRMRLRKTSRAQMEMFIFPRDFNFFDPPGKAVAGSLETGLITGLIHSLLLSSEKGVSCVFTPPKPDLPPPSLLSRPTTAAVPPASPFTQTGGTEAPYGKRPEPRPQNGVRNGVLAPGLQTERGCGCRNRAWDNGGSLPGSCLPAAFAFVLQPPLALDKGLLSILG